MRIDIQPSNATSCANGTCSDNWPCCLSSPNDWGIEGATNLWTRRCHCTEQRRWCLIAVHAAEFDQKMVKAIYPWCKSCGKRSNTGMKNNPTPNRDSMSWLVTQMSCTWCADWSWNASMANDRNEAFFNQLILTENLVHPIHITV